MNSQEFVGRVCESVTDIPGLPRLRSVFAGLIEQDRIFAMGRGLNYSRHKDSRIRTSDKHILLACHSDYTEHQDHR